MDQLEKMRTVSKEERKQMMLLLKKYSKKDIEIALNQLNKKRQ